MTGAEWFTLTQGEGPIVAAAVHAGHAMRPDLLPLCALGEAERRREEDPFSELWTVIGDSRLVAHRSRFEVDLNRPREGAVYRSPEEAWGLEVWRRPPGDDAVAASRAVWDAFHGAAERLFTDLASRHGSFVVLDLHTYNHRRGGPAAPPADPEANPEINLGTGTLQNPRLRPLADAFLEALRGQRVGGRTLDVRENVRFQGGHFPRWVHSRFAASGCALAIEVKKTFMDEWTGALDAELHRRIGEALRAALPALRAVRDRL